MQPVAVWEILSHTASSGSWTEGRLAQHRLVWQLSSGGPCCREPQRGQ